MSNWRKWKIDFGDVLKSKVEKKAKDELRRFVDKQLGIDKRSGDAKPKSDEERLKELLLKKLGL